MAKGLEEVRLKAAAIVVLAYHDVAVDSPANIYALGQSTAALAVWCDLLGLHQDVDRALDYARKLVE